MQTNPAVEQSEIIRWSESPWNQFYANGYAHITNIKIFKYARIFTNIKTADEY